jgi:hypothetical protein
MVSILVVAMVSILVVAMLVGSPSVTGASSSAFGATTSAIDSAYVALLSAQHDGGNVSLLTAKLNTALGLVAKAQAENATDPGGATLDLQNATRIALQVSNEGPTVAQEGASLRQTVMAVSVGTAGAIVIIAALVYVFGGRLYRGIWFYIYRNHTVRKRSG